MEADGKERKETIKKIIDNYDYIGDDIVDMVTTLTFGFNPKTGEYDYTLFNEKLNIMYKDYVAFNALNIDVETSATATEYLNTMILSHGSLAASPDAREILKGSTDVEAFLDRSFFKYSQLYKGEWADKDIAKTYVDMIGETYGLEMRKYAEQYLRLAELKSLGILSDANIETLGRLSKNRDDMIIIKSNISKTRKKGGEELEALFKSQQSNKYNPSGI